MARRRGVRWQDLDDLALSVGLVLVGVGVLVSLVLVLLLAPEGASKDTVTAGLLMALSASTTFFFRR